jgi:sodium-dependent dicarboxylate transporter 2/3/5
MADAPPPLSARALLSGPAAAGLVWLLLPESYADASGQTVALTAAARVTLALLAWMAAWWVTEAVDLAVTALLPAVAFPLLGVASMKQSCAPYASDTVFLFLGGFMLAQAMLRWGLDRRVALMLLSRVGARPAPMIGGVMAVTALFSAFVSNTATAAMMLPIGLSILRLVIGERARLEDLDPEHRRFAAALLLGIAYAASLGGMATLIGTPPNTFAAAFLRERIAAEHRVDLTFAAWLRVGAPMVLIFLPLCWLLLTRVLYPVGREEIEGGREHLRSELRRLGPIQPGETITMAVFCLAALSWLGLPLLRKFLPGLSDAGIALGAAFLLCVLPAGRGGPPVLDWPTVSRMPWGILILFGGGLSLADAMESHRVSHFVATQALLLKHLPPALFLILILAAVVLLSEFASNTAVAAALLPILAALAPALGFHPYEVVIPATLAASCGFMLPVATPPNTLLYGTGFLHARDMMRAGFWMNWIGIGLSAGLGWAFARWLIAQGAGGA